MRWPFGLFYAIFRRNEGNKILWMRGGLDTICCGIYYNIKKILNEKGKGKECVDGELRKIFRYQFSEEFC